MNKSFVDCSCCSLNENKQHVCLTNCGKDLKKVDTLYIIQGVEKQSDLETIAKDKKENYLITSPVLCESESDIINADIVTLCLGNVKRFYEMTSPSRVVCIGLSTKDIIPNSEYYDHFDAFTDDIARSNFEDGIMLDLSEFENTNTNVSDQVVNITNDSNELYMFKINEEYYSSDYRLVDVQYLSFKDQLVFMFRDKDNKKIFYEPERKHANYYWYESTGNRIIDSIDNLQLMIGNYKDRNLGPNCYESDIKIDVKHAVDYYLQSEDEPAMIHKNVFYFDIEIYTYKDRTFPTPDKAAYPINAVSFCFDESDIEVYLLSLSGEIDPELNEIKKRFPHLTIFTDEKIMLRAFLKRLNSFEPDILSGWNINKFDLPYIVTRMKKLGIPSSALSPYGNIYADSKSGRAIISGYVVLDQYWLYKELTYTNQPSYKLGAIGEKEVGETKQVYEGNLNTIYNDNIGTFIDYSIQDTNLLRKIEVAVNHIGLQDELRKAATTTQHAAMSTMGQADGLFMTSMKEKGLAARNAGHPTREDLPGAYVFNARGGMYPPIGEKGLLCDFDFTSLYPSIINTWNIGPNTLIGKISDSIMFDYLYDKKSLDGKTFTFHEDPIHSSQTKEITSIELDKIVEENDATINISGCVFRSHNQEESIYYSIIKSLFLNRKKNKSLMFEYKQKGDKLNTTIYNNKQQSFKILMNSLYGILGNEHFRFYNNDLARSITLSGQELLKYSAVHCNRFMKNEDDIDFDFIKTVESPLDYIIYGDTDSIFVDLTNYLKDKKIEPVVSDEVNKEIQVIQSYLNDNIMKSICVRHNLPLEYSMLQLKNEFLFSKYYALNVKKKYATKVVSQEGRKLDFIDIKGLEIKRSDFSKTTQKMLQNILNMIMSDDFSILKVNNYVEETKIEVSNMIKLGDVNVAKTVSFSKPLNEYKTITQHIKGMLMWNEIVNEDFRYGSRGYLFPLLAFDESKAPDHIKKNFNEKFLKKYSIGDLKAIVVPEELYKLPEYFIPNIKQMVSFSVTDRADLLLEPLMKKTQDLLAW